MKKKLFQPFHLVTYSPWPIITSFSVMVLLVGFMNWFNNYTFYLLVIGLITLILSMYQWWRDVIRESTLQGFHTKNVIAGLKFGMLLFIISEIFFFVSIFWCYLHMFLSPSVDIGSIWPPKNILSFNPYLIPLLNTVLLLSSGVTITMAHYSLLKGLKFDTFVSLLITVFLGSVFMLCQYIEYLEATFTMCDSIYGSVFFLSTGFHGMHVMLGTIFLIISLIRIFSENYSKQHHFGFEAAAWYWHFVDVVWLFLYLLVYLW